MYVVNLSVVDLGVHFSGLLERILANPPQDRYLEVRGGSKTERPIEVEIPVNPDGPVDFVLFVISAASLIEGEDGATLSQGTLDSFKTVIRAIASHNDKNPSRLIQPIKLVTFGDQGTETAEWCKDQNGQRLLAEKVNKNLGNDPNPILIYQTSCEGYKVEDRIYLLQSFARLLKEMMAKIPPAP